MKNTGLSASSKKIILFFVLAQFFCFKNFSLDFSSNDENPYMEKKNTEKQFLFPVQSTDKSFKTYPTTEEIILNAHKENRKSVALVLSGGGAKGFGQTGLLKELERAGIPVDMVIGSSAGALIGGFYAAGYRPEEIEEIALEMDWPELFSDESRNLYETYSKTTHNDRYFLDLGVSRNFKMEIGSSILSGQRILNLFKEKTVKINTRQYFAGCLLTYSSKKDLFILASVIIERERKLLRLLKAINYININRLLVCRCRCVVESERFFLQRVHVIGQEHCTVIHFLLSFAVRQEIASLIGRRRKYQLKYIPSAD